VVVATGIGPFYYIPDFAENLPGLWCRIPSFIVIFQDIEAVTSSVVGTGQSGLESAALLHEAGAQVEIIVRALCAGSAADSIAIPVLPGISSIPPAMLGLLVSTG